MIKQSRWVACVAMLAVVAAGCGSDDEKSSTSTEKSAVSEATQASAAAATTAQTTVAADGEPVKMMVTGSFAGPIAYPASEPAAIAAADAINAAGGIAGHPVEILACNDGADPNQAAQCAQQGIDAGVIAFVGGLNIFSAQILPRLNEAGIPWVAPTILSPDMAVDPMTYPIEGGSALAYIEQGRQAVLLGGPRVVNVRLDNDLAKYVISFATGGAKTEGGEVVGEVQIQMNQPDYSAAAAEAVGMKPDAVVCACSVAETPLLIRGLRQAGFTGPFVTSSTVAPVEGMTAIGADADNTYTIATLREVSVGGDEIAQITDETKGIVLDSAAVDTWLGVHIIADVMADQTSVDATTLRAALDGTTDASTYGLVEKIDFTATPPDPALPRVHHAAVLMYKWDGKAFVEASGGWINPYR